MVLMGMGPLRTNYSAYADGGPAGGGSGAGGAGSGSAGSSEGSKVGSGTTGSGTGQGGHGPSNGSTGVGGKGHFYESDGLSVEQSGQSVACDSSSAEFTLGCQTSREESRRYGHRK
jgi:hypothetical protein